MFWGLVLEPRKRYAKVVDASFHISSAVLDTTSCTEDLVRVIVEVDGVETIICNLGLKHGILQCPLDLNFMEGSHIAFFTQGGPSTIHLSGYVEDVEENLDQDLDVDDLEEEEEDEDEVSAISGSQDNKRKLEEASTSSVSSKKSKLLDSIKSKPSTSNDIRSISDITMEDSDEDEEEEEDEEDEEDEDEGEEEEEEDEGEEEEDEDEEGEEEEEEEEGEEEEEEDEEEEGDNKEVEMKALKSETEAASGKSDATTIGNKSDPVTPNTEKKKKKKKEKGLGISDAEAPTQPGIKSDAKPNIENDVHNASLKQEKLAVNGKTPVQKERQEKPKNTPARIDTPTKMAKKSPKMVKAGGVTCEDLAVGTGQEAKQGKVVFVYYQGRILQNNRLFDSCTSGKGFKFKIGRGEVISGWDIGVTGMKVGGKRRVVCPPQMAYGKKGAPPHIPPQSTLVFVIELKAVL